MENAPVFRITAYKMEPEHRERYRKWVTEVYYPMGLKSPFIKGNDMFQIVKESPEYIVNISFGHYENLKAEEAWYESSEAIAVLKDIATWAGRHESVWGALYRLVKYFRSDRADYWASNNAAKVQDSPIMHLEGYRLSPEAEEKYGTWLSKWGFEVYIPLLMKLPGFREYDCFRILDADTLPEVYRVKDYSIHPPYLSVLHFENMKAFEDYEKSLELAALRAHINTYFPRGLDFKWYVQYQLMKSWRK